MPEIKMNIKQLAESVGCKSIEAFAQLCNIPYSRLSNIASGRTHMYAFELMRLSDVTGIPERNILVPEKLTES